MYTDHMSDFNTHTSASGVTTSYVTASDRVDIPQDVDTLEPQPWAITELVSEMVGDFVIMGGMIYHLGKGAHFTR
jgi:hypothetical protein